MIKTFKTIFLFYYNGFTNLGPLGRKLWLLVLIKATIFLIVLNIFFPDLLGQYETVEEKSGVVADSLLGTN